MSGWEIKYTEQTTAPHVVPVADRRSHLPADCWCEPTPKDGVIVHHAMDRREASE